MLPRVFGCRGEGRGRERRIGEARWCIGEENGEEKGREREETGGKVSKG